MTHDPQPTRSKGEILVVEDNSANLRYLADILTQAGYRVRPALDGELALDSLKAGIPDLILLDIRLPGLDGIEVCRRIKANPETQHIPVVFISAVHETEQKVKALETGGVDYVTKPISPQEVLSRINIHIQLNNYRNHLEQLVAERTAALRESEQKFRTFADFTYDWEYWIGPDNNFIYISPSCRRITGYDPEAFMNNPGLLQQMVHPDDLAMVTAHELQQDKSRVPGIIDFRIITRQGDERWIGHICQAVYDDNGCFLGKRGSNRDITEKKRLQEENLKTRHLEAIGTLAGGIAHQFNNALSVVVGNLELMADDFSHDTSLDEYIGPIELSTQRMRKLTAQLMAYARLGKFQTQSLFLRRLVVDTLSILQPDPDAGITVTLDFYDHDLVIEADLVQMQMVLSALLSNAYESMENGGSVRVGLKKICRSELKDLEPPQADIESGDYACLSVSDTGHGMDENTRKRLFEPFFSTKFQGRGMGMASVFGIIKNHKGSISVSSRPGRGTIVSIMLPLADQQDNAKKK